MLYIYLYFPENTLWCFTFLMHILAHCLFCTKSQRDVSNSVAPWCPPSGCTVKFLGTLHNSMGRTGLVEKG